jgi:hypothetical protein
MSLQIPDLDDRTYDELLAEALEKIRTDLHTNWNDLSPGDPGVVLLETFAYLTEQMIYRLNRVPENLYIAFLRMMGVGLEPPYAAQVHLSFWQEPKSEGILRVPGGTRVTSQPRGGNSAVSREAVTFITVEDLDVPPDCCSEETAVKTLAYHAAWVEEEFTSSGLPGQVFRVARPPILGDAPGLKLRLGVEIGGDEKPQVNDWVPIYGGKHFRDWNEASNFAGCSGNDPVFRVDRQAGTIYFAPAAYTYAQENKKSVNGHHSIERVRADRKKALAAVPEEGRKIHVRYAVGGGTAGNIPAGLLTSIQGASGLSAQIKVNNEASARGGMDAETLDNALVRGPQEIFTQERLVTARDFERTVLKAGRRDFARARALALVELWEHAAAGVVGVTLVPALRGPEFNSIEDFKKEALESQQALLDGANLLDKIEKKLKAQSPLGVNARLDWAHYKQVSISADVTVSGEDTEDVKRRLEDMLYRKISPIPPKAGGKDPQEEKAGWGFGDSLHLADIARWMITSEPNVKKLRSLEVTLNGAPETEIHALAADFYQPKTWYAASGRQLFRSTNDADGWEQLLDFSSGKTTRIKLLAGDAKEIATVQTLKTVCPNPYRAGWVALSTQTEPFSPPRSPIYLSTDCGENWYYLADFDADVEDMDWLQRPGLSGDVLLLATSKGLREINLILHPHGQPELEIPRPIPIIDAVCATLPVSAVKVLRGQGGTARVAVAVRSSLDRAAMAVYGWGRVYLSKGVELEPTGAATNFSPLAMDSQDGIPLDIHCLGVQWCKLQKRFLLWAGRTALGRVELGDASPSFDEQRRALEAGGCCRWSFDQQLNALEPGRWATEGWTGGSCLGLAFLGNRVLAATSRGTILVADVPQPTLYETETLTKWRPVADPRNVLDEHLAFTCITANQKSRLVLAGCEQGVFRSQNKKGAEETWGETYEKASHRTFSRLKDSVTIPPNWLLVSDHHVVHVTRETPATPAGIVREDQAGKEVSHETG